MLIVHLISFSLFLFGCSLSEQINPKELKCLVCKQVVEEIEKKIDSVDPKKIIEVGTYRVDQHGNQKRKTVELRRSEVFLTELMETICTKMEDYVRGRLKSNGRLVVLPLVLEKNQMNPKINEVDLIQDSDLNKSLKFYCETILDDNEEEFLKAFANAEEHLDIKLCSDVAQLCDQRLEEDYEFENHDEL